MTKIKVSLGKAVEKTTKMMVKHTTKVLKKYHCISTPYDYSNDGREDERREAQAQKEAEQRRP